MMKKIATLILSFMLVFGLAGCFEKPVDPPGPDKDKNPPITDPLKDNSNMIDDRYDLQTYLYPLWEGTTIYNETLWFADTAEAPLLYTPDRVLSVRSYDLKTTYTEGEDYVVDGKSIVVTPDTKIPHMSREEYFPVNPPSSIVLPTADGKYWYIAEGSDISSRQVVVTYAHSDRREWKMPLDESAKFPKTMAKLENNEPIKVLFYGDSITVGANSSEFLGYGPRAESYANMVKSYINTRWPQNQMTFKNTAVGGTDSNWGINKQYTPAIDQILANEGDHFKKRVLDERPDLLFIAYGMNDQESSPDTCFKGNIREMISKVRAQNPNVEIMLISGMIANPGTGFYNKDYQAYQDALQELTAEFENVGLATTLSTVLSVYGKDEYDRYISVNKEGKRFQDCTANNANHPNDFMMRIYAQTVLHSLFGEDYYETKYFSKS